MAVLMHVDMDAFYAAVEMRRRPELVRTPMWVGGQIRGVVLSANYPARSYGVRGGMSVAQARRLCPQGVGVRPDFASYSEVSGGVAAILATVSAKVEMASIDEAYLDLTDVVGAQDQAADIGQRVRAMICDEQGITASVGIGPNRLVAKMASVAAKPDGLVEIAPTEVVSFLHPLPVERLVGVGDSTAARLRRLGVVTIGDLAQCSRSALRQALGRQSGELLAELAWGRDGGRRWSRPGERGVGAQVTFASDVGDLGGVRAEILRVSDKVAARMRAAGVVGRTVTLSLGFADFTARSGSLALSSPTDSSVEVYAAALRLHSRMVGKPVILRRVGVRVTELSQRARVWRQPTLDESEVDWDAAELAVDKLNKAFGPRSVQRAVLAGRKRGLSI
ncbi:DNA polymerase IV [Propionicimonas sp.]|uniref:DNA polymerase IV n=1 Tax=Propionicimonas sp. TaxID=1955623 RepID=UPI0018248FE2|nr:DNA polymerase IV [Propionicimonas sp.]MBU3977653.1 DNA polymerase IV [Actinomycetota bacterium]MBA3021577.1 DNA polymerase IV [Propionicimonas sp.]MBU3987127.1 DNA polymerase IV [Actinomycetota bacterium]MBU4008948.1 DNA polymerase IV [Actinomycetota bacterium]MBU4065902.1 DNA polymerase IV [Actinomycetota bacterium]